MVDYNFFENYQIKKVKKSPGLRLFTFFFFAAIIAMVGFVAFNYMTMSANVLRSIALEAQIETLKQTDDISRIETKQALLQEILETKELIESVHAELDHNSLINENTLAVIVDVMPSDTTLTSYSLSENNMTVTGFGASRPAVAELEKNWRAIDFVEEVFIGALTMEDGNISFSIEITLGGDNHEN